MNKRLFSAAAAALFLAASLPANALLNEKNPGEPAEVFSLRDGTTGEPVSGDEISLTASWSDYGAMTREISLVIKNLTTENLELTGDARLERRAQFRWDILQPERDGAMLDAAASQAPLATGEKRSLPVSLEPYAAVDANGQDQPFRNGKYRISVRIRRPDGTAFWWACTPFDIVDGDAMIDTKQLSMRTEHSAYAHNIREIAIVMANHTDLPTQYNSTFQFQRFRNGRWTNVPPLKTVQNTDAVWELPAGSSQREIISLEPYPEALPAGTYRILKSFGNGLSSAVFEISDRAQSLKLNVPVSVEVDWQGKDEHFNVTLDASDIYDGLDAMTGISQELNAFQQAVLPKKPDAYPILDITLRFKNGKSETVALQANASMTYAKRGSQWYQAADGGVFGRIREALDAAR